MGLEILLTSDGHDSYDSRFDSAREFARWPSVGATWSMAYGVYPRPEDLIVAERQDEFGPLLTHQLYQYEIGAMKSGDIILCLV